MWCECVFFYFSKKKESRLKKKHKVLQKYSETIVCFFCGVETILSFLSCSTKCE